MPDILWAFSSMQPNSPQRKAPTPVPSLRVPHSMLRTVPQPPPEKAPDRWLYLKDIACPADSCRSPLGKQTGREEQTLEISRRESDT